MMTMDISQSGSRSFPVPEACVGQMTTRSISICAVRRIYIRRTAAKAPARTSATARAGASTTPAALVDDLVVEGARAVGAGLVTTAVVFMLTGMELMLGLLVCEVVLWDTVVMGLVVVCAMDEVELVEVVVGIGVSELRAPVTLLAAAQATTSVPSGQRRVTPPAAAARSKPASARVCEACVSVYMMPLRRPSRAFPGEEARG